MHGTRLVQAHLRFLRPAEARELEDFLKKGYQVIHPGSEASQAPVDMRWFAEGQSKNVPEPIPLPAQYSEEFGKGLPTQSGNSNSSRSPCGDSRPKIRIGRRSTDISAVGKDTAARIRPAVSPAVDHGASTLQFSHLCGRQGVERQRYPGSSNSGRRVRYWIVRINEGDAARRGIRQHDLVKVHNARGAVICAAT